MGYEANTGHQQKAFQVKRSIQDRLKRGKLKIKRRLAPMIGGTAPRVEGEPEFSQQSVHYELSDRVQAISAGGIGVVRQLVTSLGVAKHLDAKLQILKAYRPYHDSDHVLNIAYNVLCGGEVLEDIEHRRNDAAFLEALGARAIPDPTTAGDYCRRFDAAACWRLMHAINDVRLKVWQKQPESFTKETARIDVDGTMVTTTGQCKEGMELSYKGDWGYHPLLVSLANTQEPLFIVNRSGNRPSHEGAASVLDHAIALCRRAGFEDILLRGDTDFTMTPHLDAWTKAGIRFVFGYDANPSFVSKASILEGDDYQLLERQAEEAFKKRRAKQPRVKEEIVQQRGLLNKKLIEEDVAEFEHRPSKAKKHYRIVVLRKFIAEEQGQRTLGHHFRYFFYVTNDRKLSAEEVVAESNDRCNQEKLIQQLKSGLRALHAPVNTLNANWAYMLMASLAWSFKAWFALMLPIAPRWRDRH